ncbi:MAG TPA: FtsH protease activity modulator HflK [Gammaproteobacteria bacterium]|nr:FtsH protease activity modulator HflK [Gammaproteobacteria bacterium]
MAWDDDNNKDPWRSRGNQGPADLDAIVKDLQRKLRGFFGGRNRGNGSGQGAGPGPGPKVGSGIVAFIVVIALGLWSATGFYIVDEAERAIVLRFGKFMDVSQPGLRWHLPWPIETRFAINTEETVTWPYQGSMLTRDENIVIVNLIIQYRRTDPEAFLFSLRDPEDTMQDVTASAIREIVGKNDLNYILTDGRLDIASQALDLLQSTLDSYNTGITVYEVNLQEAQFPEAVQESVQDVVRAREDQARSILAAETYRNQVLPNARGQAARQLEDAEAYRAQVVADAEGESRRFSQILAEYQNAPAVTRQRMHLETLEYVLSNSTKVLLDTEGGNNLMYLPLDQLMQRRSTGAAQTQTNQPALPSAVSPSTGSGSTLRDPTSSRR